MSRDWHNSDESFERFHKDRGIRKKQKRGDRRREHQRLKEVASDMNHPDELDSYEDDNEYKQTKRH